MRALYNDVSDLAIWYAVIGIPFVLVATMYSPPPKAQTPPPAYQQYAEVVSTLQNEYRDGRVGIADLQPATSCMSEDERDAAIEKVVASLPDRWSHYVRAGKSGGNNAGMLLKNSSDGGVVVEMVAFGTPAWLAGLRPGDRIESIDDPDNRVNQRDARELERYLAGLAEGSSEALECQVIDDNGELKPRTVVLNYKNLGQMPALLCGVLPGNVFYFRFQHIDDDALLLQFAEASNELWLQSGKRMDGIILDLRDCPGGLVQMGQKLAGTFIRSGPFALLHTRKGDEKLEVEPFLGWMPVGTTDEIKGVGLRYYRAPMAVLVNESTCSAAEALAMALQERGRAVLVGTRTFGKGATIDTKELKWGATLMFVNGTSSSPSGVSYDGSGIKPSVEVKLPRASQPARDLQSDSQLMAALKIVQESEDKHDSEDTIPMPASYGLSLAVAAPLLVALVVFLIVLRKRRTR